MMGVWTREMTRQKGKKGTMHTVVIQRKTLQVLVNKPYLGDKNCETGRTDTT